MNNTLKLEESVRSKTNNNKSLTIDKAKKKKKKKGDQLDPNFDKLLFEAINKVRADPPAWSEKVLDMIKLIQKDPKTGKLFISPKEGTRIGLINGEEGIKQAAFILKNTKPMPPLQHSDALLVELPQNPEMRFKKEGMLEVLEKLKEKPNFNTKNVFFNVDKGIYDPLLCLMTQIIDDTNFKGKRRENILNPNLTQIGITSSKDENFGCYLTFSS
jgi:hypothetical protein